MSVHPLVRSAGERAKLRVTVRMFAHELARLRWVHAVNVDEQSSGAVRVVCRISLFWFALLGAWHLVVRRRVLRVAALPKYSNLKVVSAWVI